MVLLAREIIEKEMNQMMIERKIAEGTKQVTRMICAKNTCQTARVLYCK
jgi:hypothetical protein